VIHKKRKSKDRMILGHTLQRNEKRCESDGSHLFSVALLFFRKEKPEVVKAFYGNK